MLSLIGQPSQAIGIDSNKERHDAIRGMCKSPDSRKTRLPGMNGSAKRKRFIVLGNIKRAKPKWLNIEKGEREDKKCL
jgi:hypothetical protein